MFHESNSVPAPAAAAATATATDTCSRCGGRFTCGMEAGASTCWCAALPGVEAVPAAGVRAECYCPACLRALPAERARTPLG